ncbi:hypothetical protein BGZ76_000460 [Entomortierella beljakovae]|nr:hypothetical protein BGZ76_000460 [Entomortierella beljakovae]
MTSAKETTEPKNVTITRAALGATAALGALYSAYTDTFTGISILKKALPETCVKTTDTQFSKTEYLYENSFTEKFTKLDVKAELRLSCMAGLLTLEGSGQYINDQKTSRRTVMITLLHSIKTKVENLNVNHEDLMECIDMKALQDNDATHVVIEVHWGASSVVSIESMEDDQHDEQEVKGGLKAALEKCAFSIKGGAEAELKEAGDSSNINYSLKVFGDVLPKTNGIPRDYQNALKFVDEIASNIKSANQGKGKPISFILLPLTKLRKYLNVSTSETTLHNRLSEEAIMRFVKVFDDILEVKQLLYDLHQDVLVYSYCVKVEDIKSISDMKSELEITEANLRNELASKLVEVRSGKAEATELETLRSSFELGPCSPTKIQGFIDTHKQLADKIAQVKILTQRGINYVGRGGKSLDTLMAQHNNIKMYILFYKEEARVKDPVMWQQARGVFLKLAEESCKVAENPSIFVFADCDMDSNSWIAEGECSLLISLYQNGNCVTPDVLKNHRELANWCLAMNPGKYILGHKPNMRCIVELRCPGSIDGPCENEVHSWICKNCHEDLEYGLYDKNFYCSCGGAPGISFQFKCKSKAHGLAFTSFEPTAFQQLVKDLRLVKETNILILGETGVGKSTWINSLVNYMTYSTLQEAQESGPIFKIPSSYTMYDEDMNEIKVIMGDASENERSKVGASATQSPRSYVFPYGKGFIRLIDTPGIGDTRGIEEDKRNFENILRHISYFDEIQGVCILLKPNEARLSPFLRFCIKELLTHLHKDAAKNIVFVFTNARSTDYKPGNTGPLLKKLLSENKSVEITLSKHTMYAMDNESVRFLAAMNHGVYKMDDGNFVETFNLYSASWDRATKESQRLIKHIQSLPPHSSKDTVSLNTVRNMIVRLTKPLTDISINIQRNICLAQEKTEDLRALGKQEGKLTADALYIPAVVLRVEDIDFPRTVCISAKCGNVVEVNGVRKVKPNFPCHNHCYLENLTTFPNPAIRDCCAMSGDNCTICGCIWNEHIHIRYDVIEEPAIKKDMFVEQLINQGREKMEVIDQVIKVADTRIANLQEEERKILEVSSALGGFLRTNAITPYNDALRSYLMYEIKGQEEFVNSGGSNRVLEGLKSTLARYETEAKILEEAMKDDSKYSEMTPTEAQGMIESLYNLPLSGQELRSLADAERNTSNSQDRFKDVPITIEPKKRKGPLSYVKKLIWGI